MTISSLAEQEVEVKDRRWLMKKYEGCFLGAELVDWLVANVAEVMGDRELAVGLGRELLHFGYIAHVVQEHDFKDEALFYVFSLDVSRTLEAKTISIVAKSFNELSAHADLPRLRLQIGSDAPFDDALSPLRVGKFLLGICNLIGVGESAGETLFEFCNSMVETPDIFPDMLRVRLLAIERRPQLSFLVKILGCCTQSSIAAYFVFLKQKSQNIGGITSVPGLWTVSVGSVSDFVIVTQTRADHGSGSEDDSVAPFTFHWSVLFLFSKLDGTLKHVTPTLTKFEGQPKEESFISQLFEKMRMTTL